ncbi:MAG: type II toxin-antitoxin system RelE/ParE family toxin [Pseudomonadota bacterium]
MIEVRQTARFAKWFGRLRDRSARARIQARVDRARFGNLGDVKSVGSGVSEMRIDVGPGYRLYFARRGDQLIVLLCGGDKSSHQKDVREAVMLAAQL